MTTPIMLLTFLVLSVATLASSQSQTTISLAFFIPRSDFGEFSGLVRSVFLLLEKNHTDFRYNIKSINISRDDDMDAIQQFCQALSTGLNAVIDMTWGGWVMGRTKAELAGIPYIRVDTTIRQFVMATDQYLRSHDAADAALIFQNEDELDQSLYYIIGNSIIRVIVLNRLEGNSANTLKRMRPTPSYYVIFADTKNMGDIFSQAINGGLTTRDSNWNLVFTDSGYLNVIQQIQMTTTISVIVPNEALCCYVQGKKQDCSCDINIRMEAVNISLRAIGVTFIRMTKQTGLDPAVVADCTALPDTAQQVSNSSYHKLLTMLSAELRENWPHMMLDHKMIYPEMSFDILAVNNTFSERIGRWRTQDGYEVLGNYKQATIKRFFRVGTVKARPWVYQDGTNEKGDPIYDGYCIRLLQKLAAMMKFDYELVFPKDGYYGSRQPDGTWNGLVADLAAGETDIIVAALTMTSEREEVIDFVAPYFDQSGISIVIRKPEQQVPLFKFMTVLKLEVWLSIVGALLITGFTIWLLDKFSPYSSANNKELYPYACREFTLKESLWFALTSFTPQGGGEAPKALSGRTLVAAYWLFVVLMLATFTANLAAFLTVERMQNTVGSLEELSRQSKINYTVTEGTSHLRYFSNMAAAEDSLYSVWKEMTLNSTGGDQSKFRVWDYPIKEQYSNILATIMKTGPVSNADEGFDRVLESKQGLFAFIHDASEIRYEVYNNCNLTEVGEPFAEQPYAIAVQQGSHLQEEISKKILDLQRDRYFETLNGIFFNSTKRNFCPNSGEDEGITLESLGGVFIATVIGLVISMLTLAGEVVYYRRQNTAQVHTMTQHLDQPQKGAGIPPVSLINVNPKDH